ncbi:TP53-regulating kinase-like protein [Leptotrombidium deliense]|uniref:non-specific serine/threonine protein kinase n=1 Tax=Leptotrombidium deliense TaxID=299467 RepID=A0A443SH97_9ACAR|nr:TP53-regulating kinase-like protein [Leptotrombidium deliense]
MAQKRKHGENVISISSPKLGKREETINKNNDLMMVDSLVNKWTLLCQGAECRIYSGDYFGLPVIRKERFVKTYRIRDLDERLTKERIRAEVRCIMKIKTKCESLGPLLPTILFVTDRDIVMRNLVDSKQLTSFLKSLPQNEDRNWLFEAIAATLANIHKCGIVHGDITTSNLLVDEKRNLIPIDFGLSSFSTKTEDRAVDLYVFERSLQTTTDIDNASFESILNVYATKMDKQGKEILNKLNEVRMRGRKRTMIG